MDNQDLGGFFEERKLCRYWRVQSSENRIRCNILRSSGLRVYLLIWGRMLGGLGRRSSLHLRRCSLLGVDHSSHPFHDLHPPIVEKLQRSFLQLFHFWTTKFFLPSFSELLLAIRLVDIDGSRINFGVQYLFFFGEAVIRLRRQSCLGASEEQQLTELLGQLTEGSKFNSIVLRIAAVALAISLVSSPLCSASRIVVRESPPSSFCFSWG